MKKIALALLVVVQVIGLIIGVTAAGNTSPEISSDAYLIKPGIGVGEILIGASRDRVRAVAGEPVSSLDDVDQYPDFAVHYDGEQVVEIIITSPRYKTKDHVSIRTTAKQFLSLYPKSKVTCFMDAGASSLTNGKLYDAIDKGIAFGQDIFQGRSREVIYTLTIHRNDIPVKLYGKVRPCRT